MAGREGRLLSPRVGGRRDELRGGRNQERRVLAAQIAIVMACVVVRSAVAAGSSPVLMPDTERYRALDGEPLFAPFAVWEGYGPGLLVQVINLLPAQVTVVAQTTIAGAVWGLAAIVAGQAARRATWPVFSVLMLVSLSPWFVLWDTWLLTEAITVAGCALAGVGIGSRLSGGESGGRIALAGACIAVLARPFVGVLILPLCFLVLARRDMSRRWVSLALLSGLSTFALWQTVTFQLSPSVSFSYLSAPEGISEVQAVDRLASRGDVPGYLETAEAHGMPPCQSVRNVLFSSVGLDEKLTGIRAAQNCPGLEGWLEQGGLPWATEFSANPGPTIVAMVNPDYWLRESWTRSRSIGLVVGVNTAMFAAIAAAVLGAVAVSRRHRLRLIAAVSWIALFSAASWAVDGLEYWRHLLPGFVLALTLGLSVLGSCLGRHRRFASDL